MSILDLFRRRSPTADWREDEGEVLLADLDSFQINGVGFGENVQRLSFLGPSESKWYDYPSKGLQLEVDDDGGLEVFVLALRPGALLGHFPPERVRPYSGRIRLKGREFSALELRGESDFVSVWGEPYWKDDDEEETLLFFEFEHVEVQVELTAEGVPQILLVTPEPLLADPANREGYGVTRAWPPT